MRRFHLYLWNVDGTHTIYTLYIWGIFILHQRHLRNERLKKKKSYRRPENVKFAVGMIVKHGKEVGVIVGWDRYDIDRSDTDSLDVNQYTMLVDQFFCEFTATNKFVHQQVYYIILTKDNRLRKVEEDAITLTTPKWIDNNEIGRYFCKFEGTHYVPNDMLAKIYPYNAATGHEIEIAESLFDY
ncbi:F-box only protein 21-like [Nylanderia fulva]|uniref:F-box only protein 21-like n=1 Tax=Nylanderia fulva TaxID=613905 RepID=UPI0010FB872D|nr:F-box only protein 21-like [Nylanderia fulva]